MTKVPEIELDKVEAEKLSEAIGAVGRHYNMETSQKALDWSNLLMALGMIYGPRMFAVRVNKAAKKADKNPANAVDLPSFIRPVNSGGVQ